MLFIILIVLMLVICIFSILYYNYPKKQNEQLFYTTWEYPELKILEDNWKTIANEIPLFDINQIDKYPKRERSAWNNEEGKKLANSLKSTWVQGWQGNGIWFNFPLMYHNDVIGDSDKICPKTVDLLKQIPSIQIAGYSILLPKSELPKHTDLTGKKNDSMACNFLLTENDANLYVKSSSNNFMEYNHKTGKLVVFDSNFEHYADNKDDKIRVILYIDFKTDTIFGKKYKGIQLATKMGYSTININLGRNYPCGFYYGKSKYGEVIVIILSDNKNAEIHFKDYDKKIDDIIYFYIWDLFKISSTNGNSIITTYNKGCNVENNN